MTYTNFLKSINKTWEKPTYKKEDRIPFIPTEEELNQLIASTGNTMTTLLQFLKETGVRIGEAILLKWLDLNLQQKTANITPEKGSNPRILPISDKLINMINQMPHNKETIFQTNKDLLRDYYCKQRKHISERLQNPRIKAITFHTFRHWKATMEYHKTKDIMHVKYVLGHKGINNTLIYVNIEQALFLSDTDEWITQVSHNETEELKLIEANFTLVRAINETTAIYKKRK